jgi:hypothetical protein
MPEGIGGLAHQESPDRAEIGLSQVGALDERRRTIRNSFQRSQVFPRAPSWRARSRHDSRGRYFLARISSSCVVPFGT